MEPSELAYERLYQAQGGACAICGRTQIQLRIDVSGGKVRGLLCRRCVFALEFLREDPRYFELVRAYLSRHQEE